MSDKATHTLRLRPDDHERIRVIQHRLGLASYTEAIRYALAVGAARAQETGPVVSRETNQVGSQVEKQPHRLTSEAAHAAARLTLADKR